MSQSQPIIKKNKSGYYEVRWSEKQPDGSWRSKSVSARTANLREAEEFLKGWLLAQRNAQIRPAETFSELAKIYLKAGATRITTSGQENNIKKLEAYFGDLTAPEITAAAIAEYTELRSKGQIGPWATPVQPGTIHKELTTLVTVLKHAAKARIIETRDIPYVSKPVKSQPRDIWLTETEEAEFLELAAQSSRNRSRMTKTHRFVWIALHTGARREAIETLKWDHVDFEKGLIDFTKTDNRVTKKRRVQVPIATRLLPVLKRAYAERRTEWVMDSPSSLWPSYDAWVKRTPYPHITPHDLRRTCATLMARAGVPLFEIAGVLGDSLAVCAQHYLHHSPGHLVNAVNRGAAVPAQGVENAAMPVQFVSYSPDESMSQAA